MLGSMLGRGNKQGSWKEAKTIWLRARKDKSGFIAFCIIKGFISRDVFSNQTLAKMGMQENESG